MSVPQFLDTNVLVMHLTGEDLDISPRATAIIEEVEQGRRRVQISDIVVFETVYILSRVYRISKTDIRNALLPIIHLPGIVLPEKGRFDDVFDVYVRLNVSFADAYHVVLMRSLGATEIASFDRHFDRIPDIVRVER